MLLFLSPSGSPCMERLKRQSETWAGSVGSDPVVEAYKRHIDRTLLRENLKLTVEDRFRKLMELQRFAAELRRAGRMAGS